jgi:putative phosphoribosyl transferase
MQKNLNDFNMSRYQTQEEVRIPVGAVTLMGNLNMPKGSHAIVIFAHGSGSSRHSSRNKFVATVLNEAGFATLLFDLLTVEEDEEYSNRFEIALLSERLIQVTRWFQNQPGFETMNFGYFGASTGAAATLEAAAHFGDAIKAVVSRGGRPDLAMFYLPMVKSPTSLIVGGFDVDVIRLNQKAYNELKVEKELVIVEGATHLFEEPGKLEEAAKQATNWFNKHLKHVYAV